MSSPISTPSGGGAISGLGEKFSPDLFTGTGNFSIPIALPSGRNGFQPEIGLQYSTGSGNGPFGLGWNLSVPGVMRKTAKGVPQYDDEKDTFILSGAEDLIALKKEPLVYIIGGTNSALDNMAGITPLAGEKGVITQYRPRTEGLFARIYHLKTNLRNCWKVMSKNGLISWYGSKSAFTGDLSLVQSPDNANNIFSWKLTQTEDRFGSNILYLYQKEDVRKDEYHQWDQNYIKEIKYVDYQVEGQKAYLMRVLFNYENRLDAFSDYKSGFDIRTIQRCQNIQIFTNPIEGEIKTRTYHFQYSDETLPADERPYNGVSLLCRVDVEGHDDANADPAQRSEFLPPLEFRYSHFKPKQQKFKRIEGEELPLASLTNPGYELIDLFGNGLQDIVQINGVIRYWRNMGDGKFDIPRLLKNGPTGFTLGDPNVQLVDANGDGRTDILINGTNLSGYYGMKHDGSWDNKAFKKYKYAPSFSFADPEVKMLDLTGDGITDVLRNGASFECFFQDKNEGWVETKRIPKKKTAEFPDVSFADPRIKLADMSGDGLQDIVMVNTGSIKYWPNLGYGKFGKPVVMKNAPRFDYPFDPTRLQIADIDGDGMADLVYIDAQKITFWINQSGNGWSEPFEITGTPFVSNIQGVRIVDLLGNGTAGVLYSFDSTTNSQQNRWFYLDLTGGTKPYLLHEMSNNMGALTRVSYLPSTRYYLADQYGMSPFNPASERKFANRKPWKTTLPFPVQVVSRVEVIDQLSKGKLTTEYVYHHGYWDGGEREFRGFGRVDQRDTETFERYNTPVPAGDASFNSSFVSSDANELEFEAVKFEHYTPPVETRNWFHLGPIGDEFGDWMEVDFSDDYFADDPNVLKEDLTTFQLLQTLPRRAKRDALRAWRGSSLRSELYALDEQVNGIYVAGANARPYTVSESRYGIRLEASPVANDISSPLSSQVLYVPKETSGYIFFSFAVSSRTTQWERGYDPMVQFSFTGKFDEYGQPTLQLSAALPRGIIPPYNVGMGTSPADEGNKILSTCSTSMFAQKNVADKYMVDRTCRTVAYEVMQQDFEDVFTLKERVFAATLPLQPTHALFPVLGFSINYFDASNAFGNGLPFGELGKYGALARTETLVLTQQNLEDAYGAATIPIFFAENEPTDADMLAAGYPQGFIDNLQNNDKRLGYLRYDHANNSNYITGWYAQSGRTKYDWQDSSIAKPRGLVLETKDIYNAWASIEYDAYQMLPVKATQYLYAYGGSGNSLETTAVYDYRIMQAKMITDPNGNRAVFDFTPLALMKQSGIIGKLNANEGDIISEAPFAYKPSVHMEYDFFAFKNASNPVWVKTIQHERHYQDIPAYNPLDPLAELDPQIMKVEYTDGFGRLLQARVQAEDTIFGDGIFGHSGLPANQDAPNQKAYFTTRSSIDPINVVVSGWKVYNNKGKVVEQYEPYFDKGFDYDDAASAVGEKVRMHYNPLGNVVRTVNPDGSEQWVVYGKPEALNAVALDGADLPGMTGSAKPSPWESYTYDANDLASVVGLPVSGHEYTPANGIVDAMGRGVQAVSRLSQNSADDITMHYTYDIQGNQLNVIDAYNRLVFINTFSIAKQALKTVHIDGGTKHAIFDSAGKPIHAWDDKGGCVINGYDFLSRPRHLWAQDKNDTSILNTAGGTIDGTEALTLRQYIVYGDDSGVPTPIDNNMLGKPYQHYDEAGLTQIVKYDFKGNPLEKFRRVISDTAILTAFDGFTPTGSGIKCYRVDWEGLDTSILESKEYHSTIEYDGLNRSTKIIYPEDVDGERKTVEPTYNRAGALEGISLNGKKHVENIAYNARGQKLLVAYGQDEVDNDFAYLTMIRFAYDPKTFRLARVKAEKYTPVSLLTEYAYVSGTTKYDQSYTYDLIGNILAVSDRTPDCGLSVSPDALQRLFEYDSLYRLVQATGREDASTASNLHWLDPPQASAPNANNCRAYVQQYDYDKLGNMLNLVHTASGNNYTRHYNYTANTNKTNSIDNGQNTPTTLATFTYDANGNQTGANSDRHYAWDYADRMKCFYVEASGSVTKFTHYLYDAAGARVKKLTWKNGGNITETTTYIDGTFEYHRKDNLGTVEQKNYLQIQGGIELRVGAYSDDGSETLLLTISDYLSSASIRLSQYGDLYDKEEFYPYGDSSLCTFGKKRYRFTGKEKDNESGLYYYGARYYSSWTGQFLTLDPLAGKFPYQSAYCYADCNPIMKNDPTGMQTANTAISSNQQKNKETNGTTLPTITYTLSNSLETPGSTSNISSRGINSQKVLSDNTIKNPVEPPVKQIEKPKSNSEKFTESYGDALTDNLSNGVDFLTSPEGIATLGAMAAFAWWVPGGGQALTAIFVGVIIIKGISATVNLENGDYEGAGRDLGDASGDAVQLGIGYAVGRSLKGSAETPTTETSTRSASAEKLPSKTASGQLNAKEPLFLTEETGEKYYRAMNEKSAEILNTEGRLEAGTETMISPTEAFTNDYDGVLFELTLKHGTTEELFGIAVRNKALLHPFPELPIVESGWKENNAFFKYEKNQVNIGLGNGQALNIVNKNLLQYKQISRP